MDSLMEGKPLVPKRKGKSLSTRSSVSSVPRHLQATVHEPLLILTRDSCTLVSRHARREGRSHDSERSKHRIGASLRNPSRYRSTDRNDANLWKKQGEVSLHAAVGRRKTHILGFLIAVELSEACMVEIMELEHSCRIWRM